MDTPEKNCNIFCRSKILSSWIFVLLKSTEVTSMYKWAMNLRISVYFHQIVPIRFRIKWYIFSMSITACFHYNTDSWVDVTSVTFKSKKVHGDKIFDRQDILQFFSEVSKDYKYVKSPNMSYFKVLLPTYPSCFFFMSINNIQQPCWKILP